MPAIVSLAGSGNRGRVMSGTSRTTRSMTALASAGSGRGPMPRTSASPAIAGGQDATSRPPRAAMKSWSSPTSRANRSSAGTGRSARAPASSCRRPRGPRSGRRGRRAPARWRGYWPAASVRQPSAGSVTTKRAPRTSPGLVPGMFSAVSVPPCASTICRLIDRPRPEFWPNASLEGRSV